MRKLLKIELFFENMNEKLQYTTIYDYVDVVYLKMLRQMWWQTVVVSS